MTIWKPIAINSNYEVSDNGGVRSLLGPGGYPRKTPHELKFNMTNSGYVQVRIPINGKFKWFTVHRLVMETFAPWGSGHVNHKDGLKLNNTLENLEWCTMSQNILHSYRTLGRKSSRCKAVVQKALDGTKIKVWESIAEAARNGFNRRCIELVCKGKYAQHRKFLWQYN